jgi:hypothetical protein
MAAFDSASVEYPGGGKLLRSPRHDQARFPVAKAVLYSGFHPESQGRIKPQRGRVFRMGHQIDSAGAAVFRQKKQH